MVIMCFFAYKSFPNLLFGVLCLPGDQSHPVCETDNKASCMLHLLDWIIGSRGFPSLERRPEFWVLQANLLQLDQTVYYGREYEEKKERLRKMKEKVEALTMAMKTVLKQPEKNAQRDSGEKGWACYCCGKEGHLKWD